MTATLSPGLAILAAAMSEAELQSQITGMCGQLHLRYYHPYDSRKSVSGWPDLFICGPGGFMWRELKTESEKPAPAQQEWLTALTACGCDAGTWRPSDYYSGRIAAELAGLAVREAR